MSLSAELISTIRGTFVVLDGPDGSGKSTQCRRLEADLRAGGVDLVACRDPGGTEIGERIRGVLLDHDLGAMDVRCETLLFMASRAQLVHEVIRPALSAGKTVLCDRYVSSTCAYQGAAGFDTKRVIELAPFAIGDVWPNLTVVLDVTAETGMKRIDEARVSPGGKKSAVKKDAMERRSIEFHRRVREEYRRLAEYYPAPIAYVDADAAADVVYARIMEALASPVAKGEGAVIAHPRRATQ